MRELTHFNDQQRARMVDVTDKAQTNRAATAEGFIHMRADTLRLIREGGIKKGDVLAVVEVKTRERDDYGDPSEAVTLKKIRRMVAAADFYVKFFKIDLPVRFDIVSVVGQGEERRIEHIPDAFYPPLG